MVGENIIYYMEIVINSRIIILSCLYLAANLGAFIYMGFDKARAVANRRRIPEAHFLFLSICFCALGVLASMLAFRHKIRKLYFAIGVPLALLENLGMLYLIFLSNLI